MSYMKVHLERIMELLEKYDGDHREVARAMDLQPDDVLRVACHYYERNEKPIVLSDDSYYP